MKVNIVNKSGFDLPKYAHEGDSGLDLKANIDNTLILLPLTRVLIPTGIHLELPRGLEAQVRGRSGLARDYGIGIAQGLGTVDSNYRGDIGVILINLGREPFKIHRGDRVAQLVISKVEEIELVEVNEFKIKTVRGSNGYGSSGI